MSQPIPFRERLAKNTLASMATNVWTIVLTLGTLPVVLEGLGPGAFGVWVFLQTFSATNGWLSVSATGLAVSATRQVASSLADPDPSRLRRSAGSAFAVFTMAGLLFDATLVAITPTVLSRALDLDGVNVGSLRVLALWFGIQVAGEHLCLAATSVLEGLQDVALARLIDAGRRTATAVSVAVVAAAGGGLQGIAVASSVATTVVTLAALLSVARSGRMSLARPRATDIRAVIAYAGTVSALTGTGVLHRTMDRTIAGITFGPGAVALVEIANQIQTGTTALLSASTYPVLSSAPWLDASGDQPGLRALFERATRYSVLLTLPVGALAITLAGPFVHTWVGSDYTEAVGLTQVAVVYVLLAAPLQAGSNLLQGVGRAAIVLRASAASVIVNLITSLILVDVIGLVGVFFGTIAGALTLFPMLVRAIEHPLGQPAVPSLRRALIAALAPTGAAAIGGAVMLRFEWSDPTTLAIGGTVGTLAAVIAALGFAVRGEERRELLSAFGRQPS